MPSFRRGDATLHYQEHGSGFPVLALAPGGMRSAGSRWEGSPWNPVAELAGRHRVITMDQRNAGSSTARITGTENWVTYAADQHALLDHLGVERCHAVGMGIGGAFVLGLLRAAPRRIVRAVVLRTIGLDGNRDAFGESFDGWMDERRRRHPETDHNQWYAYRAGMFGGINPLFSVAESVLPTIAAPMLVLRGDDPLHPGGASRLLATSVPGARLVEQWDDPEHLPAAAAAIAEFLAALA